MKRVLLTILLIALAGSLRAQPQLFYGLNLNVLGGYDVVLEIEPGAMITVTADGRLELVDMSYRAEYRIEPDSIYPENSGLLKEMGGITFDYYNSGNTYDADKWGKLRRAGVVMFEYFDAANCPFPELHGLLKRAGYLEFSYFTPDNSQYAEKWWKIARIEFLNFDYYAGDNTLNAAKFGLLREVNENRFDYRVPARGIDNTTYRVRTRGQRNFTECGIKVRINSYIM